MLSKVVISYKLFTLISDDMNIQLHWLRLNDSYRYFTTRKRLKDTIMGR